MRRGQATTELALGLLVFVTVLLFGLFLAELPYLSLKVTEATGSAVWDATAMKAHHFVVPYPDGNRGRFYTVDEMREKNPGGTAPYGANVEERATRLYANLDGRSTAVGSRGVMQQVVSRGAELLVSCEPVALAALDVDPNGIQEVFRAAGGPGGRVDGASCNARATVFDLLPRSFADGSGGFFRAPHAPWQGAGLTVCGIGGSTGGACTSALPVVLGDWGFGGSVEWCTLFWGEGISPTDSEGDLCNRPYFEAVKRLYDANGRDVNTAAVRMADWVSKGHSPMRDTGELWVAQRGEHFNDDRVQGDDNWPLGVQLEERQSSGGTGPVIWSSSPFRTAPSHREQKSAYWNDRGQCFLGTRCGARWERF